MSAKIAKRMMASVDDMVSRASLATKRTDLTTSKRKAAKRALLGAPSKRSGKEGAVVSKSGSISKKARKSARRPKMGLLEQARIELRGKSRAVRNVSLLSYAVPPDSVKGAKSRKAVDHLLRLGQGGAK